MTLIITWILILIKFLNNLLFRLECFLVDKYVSNTPSENPVSPKYRRFKVDSMPKIQVIDKLDYKRLLQDYLSLNGKELKPVNHHKNSKPVSSDIFCPRCSAPSLYLYDNSGGRGQLACKVCQTTFSKKESMA